MKFQILSVCLFLSFSVEAKELKPSNDLYINEMKDEVAVNNFDLEAKVTYLSKLIKNQQKTYEDKITYLETELRKSKDHLIEKMQINESLVEALNNKQNAEAINLKKELASKTKSLFEYQRQIEKMNPAEDLKNMIKLNTELASELRRSEDQIAVIHLKGFEAMPGVQSKNNGLRMPASTGVPIK